MLQAISWLQFSSTIFIGLVVYYGYFLHRYYGARWLRALAARMEKMALKQEAAVEEPDDAEVAADEKEKQAGAAGQLNLFK